MKKRGGETKTNKKKKLKVAATRVRKKSDKLRDINMTATEALERETKKAKKESVE